MAVICGMSDMMCQQKLHVQNVLYVTSEGLINTINYYTGWRKKNACFSNNCNFVYFQYKKIMSTPKQPVINAVLITYINYSIMENYIGKMASFLPYTHPEPLLKVLHHISTNISCGTVAISSRMGTFRSSTVRGFRT